MCTLIVLHRCEAGAPLLVAANRDEYLERPSEAPALRRAGRRGVVAPLDLRAGGTWLGVNELGLFAALTNRPGARDPSLRSRGQLVMDALACGSALEAARYLERSAPRAYNAWNAVVADAAEAFALVYEDKAALTSLEPGVHVIGNVDPDDRSVPKIGRLLDAAEAVAAGPPAARLAGLAELCRSHEAPGGPLDPPCVHAGGYGTRSSTLLRLADEPAASLLRHADGPPCTTAYDDFTPLLRALQGTHRPGVEAIDARRDR